MPASGISLYIHWPFCASKCPYCDFNSHVSDSVNQDAWQRALVAELDWATQALKADNETLPTVTSIFFGGGTPSLMPPATTEAVISRIQDHFHTASDLEITLEANPSSVEAAKFRDFAQAGVNRLSLGIQALDDTALQFLGRAHDHTQALQAIDIAAKTFDRYSFDLIYARPDQTPSQWRTELKTALELTGEHLSLYQLTIETGTPFARDGIKACNDIIGEELYQITQDMLQTAGLPAYEISNHAKPGAECRHNLTYWRGGGFLGIGPGAHGRLNRADGWQSHYRVHTPARWLELVQQNGHGTAKETLISSEERLEEALLMGLRLNAGITVENFKAATGQDLHSSFDTQAVKRLTEGGFLVQDAAGMRATPEGLLRLNAVIAQLV